MQVTVWGFNIKDDNADLNSYGGDLPMASDENSLGYISIGFGLDSIPAQQELEGLWANEGYRSSYKWQVEQFLGYHKDAMRIGDYVVLLLGGRPICAVGRIDSEPELFHTPYGHNVIRRVYWLNREYMRRNWRGTSVTPVGTMMRLNTLNTYLSNTGWSRERIEAMFKANRPLDFKPIDADSVVRDEKHSVNDLVLRFGFLPPSYFEDLVGALVQAQGYSLDVLWRTGATDGGVDIIAKWRDELFKRDGKENKVYIQVKRKHIDQSMLDHLVESSPEEVNEVILVTSKEIPGDDVERMKTRVAAETSKKVKVIGPREIALLAAEYHRQLPGHVATILNLYSGGQSK